MPGRRPRTARSVTLGSGLMLVLAGCLGQDVAPSGGPTRPPGTSPGQTAVPSGIPSTGPFEPMRFPTGDPAPCDEDASDDPAFGPYRGSIRSIAATDERTVVFELCDSDPAFLAKVASPALAINDTAWLQSRIDPAGGPSRILTEVNGTGPFRLAAFGDGQEVTLSRFDGYWGERARTRAAVFVAEGDARRRLEKVTEGSVDAIDVVAPADIPAVDANPDLTLIPREGLNVAYIGFNDRFAPFDRAAVRQAISVGIDRAAILEAGFPPGTELATHFLPCAIQFGCEGGPWPDPDPTLAREWLAGAGFPDGFATTITFADEPRDYLPEPRATATALQVQLREYLGIEATLEAVPFETLTAEADTGRLDGLYLLGARTRYPDATVLLDRHFGPDSSAQFGARREDVLRALELARTSADPAVRALNYGRANDRLRAHVPMIPLAHVGSAAAFRSDLRGGHATATATDRWSTVVPGDRAQFVMMQSTRPASLYCADETEDATLRICAQLSESLYRLDIPEPRLSSALAEQCVPDPDLVIWTCTLRSGVRFHDGSLLDANDVVLSYAVQWDATHLLHRGREGAFQAFQDRFGGFLHPPPSS